MRIVETLLVEAPHKPGNMAKILGVIGECGITVEGVNAVRRLDSDTIWEVTIEYDDNFDIKILVRGINDLADTKIVGKSDRVFNRHKGGKIKTVSKLEINSLEVLRDVYTPGVARVCELIRKEPQKIREFTNRSSTVAVITNGTAILGLGDIGCEAGLPVMEGKAALLSELAGLSGVPILVEEKDPQKIVQTVKSIYTSFGAILLEDIKAPECFEVEEQLIKALPIPVFHDDQHGTAMVVLAALLTIAKRLGIDLREQSVGQVGLGAAGMGICTLLMRYGVKDVVGCDINTVACEYLEQRGGQTANLEDLMLQADIVIATTGVKGLIKPELVRKGQIILALTNPDPEIEPDVAIERGALYASDGKTVNNMLAFPGLFRGALDAGVSQITHEMKIAVSETLSDLAKADTLVPQALNQNAHDKVYEAVYQAALKTPSQVSS
ncbi:MAG: NADP-dependent malic enzyme [Pseudomonadota bacterium]